MKSFLLSLVLVFSTVVLDTPAQAQSDISEQVRQSWGFNLGFGASSSSVSMVGFRFLTPGYFKYSDGGWVRFYGELLKRNLNSIGSPEKESVGEFSLGVQVDSPIMNNIFSFHSRFGVGSANLPDSLYDGNVVIMPIAFGFNLYSKMKAVRNWSDVVLGVEYRFLVNLGYDSDKELVSNAEAVIGSGVFFNASWLFDL